MANRLRSLFAGVFATALTFGTSGHALENLRITIPVPAMVYYPIFVARDLGYFKNEGLDLEVVVTQGDGPDIDALIAGSVQFAATTPNRLFTAYQGGKPLLGVLSLSNRLGINCFMSKQKADALGIMETTPVQDKLLKLKGLVVGATRPGAFTYLVAVDYLKRAGYVPQEDAKIIGAGGGPAMLAAVENNKLDLACISSPTPELAVSRGQSIMFMNNSLGWDKQYDEFMFAILYVRPDYAKNNAGTVRKVIKSLQSAMSYISVTPFEQQKDMLIASFGGVDERTLRKALTNVQAAIEPSGQITQSAYKAASDFLIATDAVKGNVPYEAVIDNSYQSN
jgi:NitT/TauT family transport system substrate-binding protein